MSWKKKKRINQSSWDPLQQLPEANFWRPGVRLTTINIWELTHEEGDERELTDVDSQPSKPLRGSVPRIDSDSDVGGSGVGESSRYGRHW